MQHGGGADARAEVLGIGGDRRQCFGGCAEQEVVDHRLVLQGDLADLRRQREHDVVIGDRQQIGLARLEPPLRRRALALRTMAVTTRIVGDPAVVAVLAAFNMAAKHRRAAGLDRRHHLKLAEAHMAGIGPPPVGPMAMKDVCDLQPRAAGTAAGYASGRGLSSINGASRSSGLVTARIVVLATRV